MLDKKQNRVIFLFEFKMGCKAVETTQNINKTFAQKYQCSGDSISFAKETRALKRRSTVVSNRKVTMTNREPLSKLIVLKLHEKLLKNSTSVILWSFGIWSRLERWKSSVRWVPHKMTENQKNYHFEVLSSLILCNNNKPFLNQIATCAEKWNFYDNRQQPAQWLDREAAPKHFPRWNLHQKRSWSLFGGLLPIWATTAFWILAKPLHLRSMLSKSMRCTEDCSVCSQHWWTERAQFFQATVPEHTSHNLCFRSWANLATFASLAIFTDLSPTTYHFFKHLNNFLQGKCFHNQQDAENAFQEFIKFWSTDFYATGINKLISHWQKCVDCNGSY